MNAGPNMSRDLENISAGRRIPVHTHYEGVAVQIDADISKARNLATAVRKILKRAEIGSSQHKPMHESNDAAAGRQVFNVHGANARINVRSIDRSTNVVQTEAVKVFADIRNHIEEGVADTAERARLIDEVKHLEESHRAGDYLAGYERFIATAANHMTVLAPFIPALTKLIGG